MKNWVLVVVAVCALVLPGRMALADEREEEQKIYLDEEYEEGRDWALGIGLGLVDLGDDFVVADDAVIDIDDVEQYLMLNLRIPFGDRHAHGGSSAGGFRGYLEPELGYWDGDISSDMLLGINIVGGMPFNAVEFFIGGGIGLHFIDSDLQLAGGDDSDEALGVNAHFGVDVSVSDSVSLFGMGRFDLVDDDRDELEGKASVGLRFRF
ncbi:MAG: hypothetical protein GY769_01225 [bacterium]|nr:hypothetical protein [bacterium]